MYKSPTRRIMPPRTEPVAAQSGSSQDSFAMAKVFFEEMQKLKDNFGSQMQEVLNKHLTEHSGKIDAHLKRISDATQKLERERAMVKGDKGDTPIPGKDFLLPQDGVSPKLEDIVPHVIPHVLKALPPVKHGKTPMKGVDYFDGKPGKNADPEDVVSAIKEKKLLTAEHIDGWEASIEATVNNYNIKKGIRPYIHGGGDTVSAGSGIGIITVNGNKVITNTNLSGFTTLTATETPNGSTTVFTFSAAAAQPSFIITDNVWQRATTKSGTVNWTWNNGTKKATFTIPPVDEILGIV